MKDDRAKYSKPQPADYGNSIEFAMLMLVKHWGREHGGIPGIGEERLVTCMTCRNLWLRASATIVSLSGVNQVKVRGTPINYQAIVARTMKWCVSVDGRQYIRLATDSTLTATTGA